MLCLTLCWHVKGPDQNIIYSGYAISITKINCNLFIIDLCFPPGSGQDSLLFRQLKQSNYLQTLMKTDSAAMGFTRWKKKEIIRSYPLPLVSVFNDLKIKGPGTLKIAKDVTVSGEGSILLETPASLAVKTPAIGLMQLPR